MSRRGAGEGQFQQYQPEHRHCDRGEEREEHPPVGGEPLEAHARRVRLVGLAPLVEPLDARPAVPEEPLDRKQCRGEDESAERLPSPGHAEDSPDGSHEEGAGRVHRRPVAGVDDYADHYRRMSAEYDVSDVEWAELPGGEAPEHYLNWERIPNLNYDSLAVRS